MIRPVPLALLLAAAPALAASEPVDLERAPIASVLAAARAGFPAPEPGSVVELEPLSVRAASPSRGDPTLPRCLGLDGRGIDIMEGNLPARTNPSGALWHPRLERLLIVDDGDATGGGAIYSMKSDGTGVERWSVPGDLEGIAYADPESDLVYVGVEEPAAILEFDLRRRKVLREFDLSHWISAGPVNRGLEALAFVPDPKHPEGGRFYAGHQATGRVFLFSLPLRSDPASRRASYLGHFTPRWLLPSVLGTPDVAGLDFDRDSGLLFVIFDLMNRIVALKADPSDPAHWTRVGDWELPGSRQEGIAIRPDTCELFIAGDGGEILRFPPKRRGP